MIRGCAIVEKKRKDIFVLLHLFFFCAVWFFVTEKPAEAYLDPAAGNALIYTFVALAGAGLYALKGVYYWMAKRVGVRALSSAEAGEGMDTQGLVLFCEGKNYWSTFKPIVESLLDKKQPFSYYTMDIHDPGLSIENECMHARYIGKGARAFARVGALQADILLATSPNIGTPGYPIPRSPRIKSLFHVLHAVMDLAWYRKGSLDFCDAVLMIGPYLEQPIRFLEELRGTNRKELVCAGAPYLDTMAQEVRLSLPPTDGKTILVAPSWGTKGCLSLYGGDFIRRLAEAQFHVILRPHPQSMIVQKKLMDDLRMNLARFPNVEWDFRPTATFSMERADLMISDISSVRFDFAFLYGRPVITLDMPIPDPEDWEYQDLGGALWMEQVEGEIGEKIGKEEIHNIAEYVRRTLEDAKTRDFRELRDRHVSNFGRSGDVIADYLIAALEEKAERKERA